MMRSSNVDSDITLDSLIQLLRQADGAETEIVSLLASEEPHDRTEMDRQISALSQRYQAIMSAIILLEQRRRTPLPALRRQQRTELGGWE
jgi:hypothetical protein